MDVGSTGQNNALSLIRFPLSYAGMGKLEQNARRPLGFPFDTVTSMPRRRIMGVEAMAQEQFPCGILTVSDTSTFENDAVGSRIQEKLEKAGFPIQYYHIVPKVQNEIRECVWTILKESSINLLIIAGGAGPGLSDVTPEAVEDLFHRRLDGFGELFRRLSYEVDGPASIFARTTAGITKKGVFVFVIPGSVKAADLALDKLILPEMRQIASGSEA
jgi:molybdenum cofactor biosynthesis protein B